MGSKPIKKLAKEDVKLEAMAWAEFIYKEYLRVKREKLLNTDKCQTMEEPTNHDILRKNQTQK